MPKKILDAECKDNCQWSSTGEIIWGYGYNRQTPEDLSAVFLQSQLAVAFIKHCTETGHWRACLKDEDLIIGIMVNTIGGISITANIRD